MNAENPAFLLAHLLTPKAAPAQHAPAAQAEREPAPNLRETLAIQFAEFAARRGVVLTAATDAEITATFRQFIAPQTGAEVTAGRVRRGQLTAFAVIEQSAAIHPDWTAEDHAAYLQQEGYDLAELSAAYPLAYIAHRISQLTAGTR